MDPNGDISDAFEDEDLKRSIAGTPDDPWRSDTPFTDPKLEELEQQLQHPPHLDYHRRRLVEMQSRVEHGGTLPKRKERPAPPPRKAPAPPKPAADADRNAPWGPSTGVDPWAETPAASDRAPATPAPAAPKTPPPSPTGTGSLPRWREPVADPTLVDAVRKVRRTRGAQRSMPIDWQEYPPGGADRAAVDLPPTPGSIARYTPSLIAATLVFVTAAALLVVLTEWQTDLVYRAIGAIAATGILWRRLQTTRVRAIAIASVCYALAFATTERIADEAARPAILLCLVVVVAGAGLVGVQRDPFAPKDA